MKIKDLQKLMEERLSRSFGDLPEPFQLARYRVVLSLVANNHRKESRRIRQDASAEHWSPQSGGIWIKFEPNAPTTEAEAVPPAPAAASASEPAGVEKPSNELRELVRSLDQAESRPGYSFVALKWFRDTVLPVAGAWASDPDARNRAIRNAIERGLVLTSKVPNPNSPAFPVTSIRLNRSSPEIAAILGVSRESEAEFEPAEIRGELLSATVLRERR